MEIKYVIMNVQNDAVKLTAKIDNVIHKRITVKKTENGFDIIDKSGNVIVSPTNDELNPTIRNGFVFASG